MEPQTLWRNRPLKTNILDIQFDNLTREEARQAGAELLRSSDFHYAVTPNPEFILTADKDLEFQKILNQADLVLPDGIGVVYSAKILGTPLKERVAGFDFACDMLDVLDEMGCWAPSPAWPRRQAAVSWSSTPTSFCAASMTAIFRTPIP